MAAILCINGSDSTGHSGIQSDIKTIKDLGGYAVTALTSVTVQNNHGIICTHELPTDIVTGQIKAIYSDVHPKAVKIGLINNPDTIRAVREEVVGCNQIVCSPGILSSNGGCLMNNESISAFSRLLFPICTLLMLKCTDAEIILGRRINTDKDMVDAAKQILHMGPQWVLLRGGTYTEGRINALLLGPDYEQFFSSINIEGWQMHGIGGTLSTAIAAYLALGQEVPDAIKQAHDYMHSQVVYATSSTQSSLRPHDLYNTYLSLIAKYYKQNHDVTFFADKMRITPRYLSQVTKLTCGRSPKQIIDSHIMNEAETLLSTTLLSIQQIADTLGFGSQVVFAKFFKSKKGCSPTSFRNR